MEELIKALNTIKEECKKHGNCDECPIGNDDCDCLVGDSSPEDWNIIEPKAVIRVMD